MFRRKKAKDRIEEVAEVLDDFELPTFPAVVTEALGRLGDPDVDLADVADVLVMDPGITAKLLSLANSAATGLKRPVNDLRQVVAILGRNQVESILISAAVRAALPNVQSPVFDSTRFWQAAAERAVIATAVTGRLAPAQRSEAFTAALLQDMALPVLVDKVEGYDRLLARWYEGDITDLAHAELDTFGWDHAAVAGRMGTMWSFPTPLLDSLTEHHDGLGQTVQDWTRLVADWREADGETSRDELVKKAVELPQLHGINCEELVDDALDNVDEVSSLFR